MALGLDGGAHAQKKKTRGFVGPQQLHEQHKDVEGGKKDRRRTARKTLP